MVAKEEKNDDFDKKVFLEEQLLPNVLVANKRDDAAPVIYEPNPTYQNLFGKIEYTNIHGSVFTNYRMIQPGALHRANGGYLLKPQIIKKIESPEGEKKYTETHKSLKVEKSLLRCP